MLTITWPFLSNYLLMPWTVWFFKFYFYSASFMSISPFYYYMREYFYFRTNTLSSTFYDYEEDFYWGNFGVLENYEDYFWETDPWFIVFYYVIEFPLLKLVFLVVVLLIYYVWCSVFFFLNWILGGLSSDLLYIVFFSDLTDYFFLISSICI